MMHQDKTREMITALCEHTQVESVQDTNDCKIWRRVCATCAKVLGDDSEKMLSELLKDIETRMLWGEPGPKKASQGFIDKIMNIDGL